MATAAFVAGDVYAVDGTSGIDFLQVDTTAKWNAVGAKVMTNKGPAIYALAGVGGWAAGQFLQASQSATTGAVTLTIMDSTTSGSTPQIVAVAITAVAAASYGWALTGPFNLVPTQVANSVSSLAALTTTATAGEAGAGGDTIIGAYLLEASGASGLTATAAVNALGTNI